MHSAPQSVPTGDGLPSQLYDLHFRVDASSIVPRVLEQLVELGERDRAVLSQAIKTYRLDSVATAPPSNSEDSP